MPDSPSETEATKVIGLRDLCDRIQEICFDVHDHGSAYAIRVSGSEATALLAPMHECWTECVGPIGDMSRIDFGLSRRGPSDA